MCHKYLFIFLLMFLSIKSYSQLQLPKSVTTQKKAVSDLNSGITNENWFEFKDEKGFITFSKIFKGTPVGIRHALSEYERLMSDFNAKNCIDKSLYSSVVKDINGSIDFELLSMTIETESSEILKICDIKDKQITRIALHSNVLDGKVFLSMFVITKIKE